MAAERWTAADAPRLDGRLAVVTGANTGLGFETASVLAAPSAAVTVQRLDLSSLISARTAADELATTHPQIDLLINNAGVMFTPKQTTWGTSRSPDYCWSGCSRYRAPGW